MASELEQIARRIRVRDEQQASDRARQRALIRERKAEGRTYDEIELEARVSRPTIRNALHRAD